MRLTLVRPHTSTKWLTLKINKSLFLVPLKSECLTFVQKIFCLFHSKQVKEKLVDVSHKGICKSVSILIQSNLVIIGALKLFLNAKSSLSLWSKWQIGHGKWLLSTNSFLIKPFLITKFDCSTYLISESKLRN